MDSETYNKAKEIMDEIKHLSEMYEYVDDQGVDEIRVVTERGNVYRYKPADKSHFLTMVRDKIDLLEDQFKEL